MRHQLFRIFVPAVLCLVGWLVSERPRQHLGYISDGPQDRRLTIISAATHKTEWGDHDFCLNRSHTDTDPTSKGRGSNPGPPYLESRALPTELYPLFKRERVGRIWKLRYCWLKSASEIHWVISIIMTMNHLSKLSIKLRGNKRIKAKSVKLLAVIAIF